MGKASEFKEALVGHERRGINEGWIKNQEDVP